MAYANPLSSVSSMYPNSSIPHNMSRSYGLYPQPGISAYGPTIAFLPSHNSSLLSHPSPMLTQPTVPYPSHPPQGLRQERDVRRPRDRHPAVVTTAPPPQSSGHDNSTRAKLEDLWLSYIGMEETPAKVTHCQKLERAIIDYLSVTPYDTRFTFAPVWQVLRRSVEELGSRFNPKSAALAFESLAHYGINLLAQPWRPEYKEISLYNGFWMHTVASHLSNAETLLSAMGYASRTPCAPARPDASSSVWDLPYLDPDCIARVAQECLVASGECKIWAIIRERVNNNAVTWHDIVDVRQEYNGSADATANHLAYTLRRRKPSPPGLSRLSTNQFPSVPVSRVSYARAVVSPVDSNQRLSIDLLGSIQARTPDDMLTEKLTAWVDVNSARQHHSFDATDGMASRNRLPSSCVVPTARLIEIELPNELPSTSKQFLPKVISKHRGSLPHPPPFPTLGGLTPSAPLLSPPELPQSGTLDDHMAASISRIKDMDIPPKEGVECLLESWDYVFSGLDSTGYNKDVGNRRDILLADRPSHGREEPASVVRNGHPSAIDNVSHNSKEKDNHSFKDGHTSNHHSLKDNYNLKDRKPIRISQALNETRERVEPPAALHSSLHHSSTRHHNGSGHKRSSLYDNISNDNTSIDSATSAIRSRIDNRPNSFSRRAAVDGCHPLSGDETRDATPSNRPVGVPLTWSCTHCTFINQEEGGGGAACAMCHKSRSPGPEMTPLESGGHECPKCTLVNDRSAKICAVCSALLEGSSTYI